MRRLRLTDLGQQAQAERDPLVELVDAAQHLDDESLQRIIGSLRQAPFKYPGLRRESDHRRAALLVEVMAGAGDLPDDALADLAARLRA